MLKHIEIIQEKAEMEKQRNEKQRGQIKTKQQNGRTKSNNINKSIKCKWFKHTIKRQRLSG